MTMMQEYFYSQRRQHRLSSVSYTHLVGDVNSQDMSDTKAKLEKRVQDYSTEAQVYFEGSDRITVDIPGATDANAVLQELGKPGTLIFCTDSSDPEAVSYTHLSAMVWQFTIR